MYIYIHTQTPASFVVLLDNSCLMFVIGYIDPNKVNYNDSI